jgi:hypothetical protein
MPSDSNHSLGLNSFDGIVLWLKPRRQLELAVRSQPLDRAEFPTLNDMPWLNWMSPAHLTI